EAVQHIKSKRGKMHIVGASAFCLPSAQGPGCFIKVYVLPAGRAGLVTTLPGQDQQAQVLIPRLAQSGTSCVPYKRKFKVGENAIPSTFFPRLTNSLGRVPLQQVAVDGVVEHRAQELQRSVCRVRS